MSSSTCELNANGPRLSRVSSKRDAGAVAASLPHVLAIATTARVCQLRCRCHRTSPQGASLTHTVRGRCAVEATCFLLYLALMPSQKSHHSRVDESP